MDPVTLILTALAAGAAARADDTASWPVRDAYAGLTGQLMTRLASWEDGELTLARYEQAPEKWQGQLAAELAAAGADQDDGVVIAAQAVMSVADAPGWRSGNYSVQARGGQGGPAADAGLPGCPASRHCPAAPSGPPGPTAPSAPGKARHRFP
jgi:hypothetical protein